MRADHPPTRLDKTKAKNLNAFLRRELSSIDHALAKRLVAELAQGVDEDEFDPETTACKSL